MDKIQTVAGWLFFVMILTLFAMAVQSFYFGRRK